MHDPILDTMISHFHILAKLGEGGMGRVYKARDLNLQRIVALKFLAPAFITDQRALSRFHLEAIAASAINHPNICTIYEIGTEDSEQFIVMEYIEGHTLRALLKQHGMLPQSDVMWIMEQICSALELAHEAGIVHQDLKPENIMIAEHTRIVKITDFGLAKLAEEHAKVSAHSDSIYRGDAYFSPDPVTTQFSSLMGTAAYMSPEQVKRQRIDFRSDLFVLGSLMYELLSGERRFPQHNSVQVLNSIVDFDPSVIDQDSKLPDLWKPLLATCLQPQPQDRYTSARALQADISHLKRRLPIERGIFVDDDYMSRRSMHLFRWIGGAVLFVFFILILWVGGKQWLHLGRQPQPAYTNVAVDTLDVTTTSAQAYHFFKQGQESWWRYDTRDAISRLQTAVDLDSTFAYANALLGLLLHWHDRPEQSKIHFAAAEARLTALNANERLFVEGLVHHSHGEIEEMLADFSELSARDSTHIDAHLLAALACEILHNFDQAIEFTKKVLKIDSTHIAAYNNLASLYDMKHNYAQALVYAQQQLECIQQSGNLQGAHSAYEAIGLAYHNLNQPELAEPNLRASLEIDPQNQDATRYLAEVLALQGRISEAQQTLQQALAQPMKDHARSRVYLNIAHAHVYAGRYVDAYDAYQKAANLYKGPQYRVFISQALVAMHANHSDLLEELMERIHKTHTLDVLQSWQG